MKNDKNDVATPVITDKATTQEEQQTNVIPDGKNAEQKLLTKEQVNDIVEGRLARQERELTAKILGEYGVENKAELQDKMAQLKQADEKRIADEEAQKTEVEKLDVRLNASTTLHEQDVALNRDLLIKIAIMERAPGKEVDPAHFRDLYVLLDKSGIEITDGVVNDKTVDAAIDAILEGRDYLKIQAQNGQRPGSPPSKKMLPNQQQTTTQQPVTKQRRKPSM